MRQELQPDELLEPLWSELKPKKLMISTPTIYVHLRCNKNPN
jgi:hypothetical protein